MPVFKVIGVKEVDYYTVVNADDEYQAYDVANELDSTNWSTIETDTVIEPIKVELQEDFPAYEDEEFHFDPINIVGDTDEV